MHQGPAGPDHKLDWPDYPRTKVLGGVERLRAEDRLDRMAQVESMGAQLVGKSRRRSFVDGPFAHEKAANSPRDPPRGRGLVEQDRQEVGRCPPPFSAEKRFLTVIALGRGVAERAVVD